MAWRPRPASWRWLLAHEARLLWRASGGGRWFIFFVIGGILMLAMHLAGWLLMRQFDLETLLRAASPVVVMVSLFAVLLVVSSAFGLAVSVLFGRGDMDLLMSSPVPIRHVYAVRGIAVGLASVSTVAVFWLPFANMGPFHGRWGTLAAYPVLLALGLLCAAVAFAGTLALTRMLGARRARVAAQVAGAFVGVFLVLLMQLETVLPKPTQLAIRAWMASEEGMAWLGPHSLLTWPARALFGDPLPMVATIVACVAIFVLVVRFTSGAFAGALQEGGAMASPGRRETGGTRPFRTGLARVVIAKELRLIARDPTLIAKSLLQMLYLLPLMLILIRRADVSAVIAASLVMVASSLAGTFAWIAVSGEEAPDLLGSAPVSGERIRWLKVGAALLPVAVLVLPFLAWFAWLSPRLLAIAAVFLAAGLASSAVIQVWTGVPGQARDLRTRNKKNIAANFVEAFSSIGWAAGCYLAAAGFYKAIVAGVILGLAGPVAAWFTGRGRKSD